MENCTLKSASEVNEFIAGSRSNFVPQLERLVLASPAEASEVASTQQIPLPSVGRIPLHVADIGLREAAAGFAEYSDFSAEPSEGGDLFITEENLTDLDNGVFPFVVARAFFRRHYVSWFGKGTRKLARVIFDQTSPFVGKPELSDLSLFNFISRHGADWQRATTRYKGWRQFARAVAYQKAGWFTMKGELSRKAIELKSNSDIGQFNALVQMLNDEHLDLLNDFEKRGGEAFLQIFRERSPDLVGLTEREKTVYWLKANGLLDDDWKVTARAKEIIAAALSDEDCSRRIASGLSA